MHLTHLTPADYVRMPWKNGLGTTTEIARSPSSGEFDWRISSADVSADGPFSKFPGCDRVILTLEGAGMTLTHAEAERSSRIGPLEAWAFSGDWTTDCVLLDGPIRDFNVITRRDEFTATVSVMRMNARATLAAGADVLVLYCADGAIAVGDLAISPGETLLAHPDDRPGVLDLDTGRATMIVVRLTSVGTHRQLA